MKGRPKRPAALARRAHLALQARRDAVAKMRLGETVSLRLVSGDTVFARGLRADEDPSYWLCLAVIQRRLRADWCSDKDGLRVGPRRLRREDILGVVISLNGADPYTRLPEFVRRPMAAAATPAAPDATAVSG